MSTSALSVFVFSSRQSGWLIRQPCLLGQLQRASGGASVSAPSSDGHSSLIPSRRTAPRITDANRAAVCRAIPLIELEPLVGSGRAGHPVAWLSDRLTFVKQ